MGHSPLIFGPGLLWPNGRPSLRLLSTVSYLVINNIGDNANFQPSCNLLLNCYDYVLLPRMGNVIHAAISYFTTK